MVESLSNLGELWEQPCCCHAVWEELLFCRCNFAIAIQNAASQALAMAAVTATGSQDHGVPRRHCMTATC